MFFGNYDLEKMVKADHPLREIKKNLRVEGIGEDREELKKSLGRAGYGNETGLRALFLQYYGDFSDREMEEQLRDNMAYRWFCDFKLEDATPDHSYFGRVRKNMGEKRIQELFTKMVDEAVMKKVIKKIESFVDASAIRRKEAEWAKRDKEIEKEKLGNKPEAKKFSADGEAKWGCKGGKKYWFGYKRHVSVDTGSGLIEAVDVTPANVMDSDGFKLVCPWRKSVIGDKGYDAWSVYRVIKRRGCQSAILRKKIRRDYNQKRNRFLSRRRAPWEHVFSKMSKRTRYMGLEPTTMQAIWEAIVHNMKRLMVLQREPIPIIGLS